MFIVFFTMSIMSVVMTKGTVNFLGWVFKCNDFYYHFIANNMRLYVTVIL